MVKEKPNSTRTYDEEGFRRRAACLCVKDEHKKEVIHMFLFDTQSSDNNIINNRYYW